jgi:hypothetical protein
VSAAPARPRRALLPAPLFERFSGSRIPTGGAVLLVTIDEDGLPRTAMLAPSLVVARNRSRLVFPLAPYSRSAANLAVGRGAALMWSGREEAWRLRGWAKRVDPPLASLPGALVFELTLAAAERDDPLPEEKGSGLRSGLVFHAPAPLRAAWKRARAEMSARR